jgi:death-on-curing protein
VSRPSAEPTWLPRIAIEAAHADQIRTHGGQLGLRDEGLLESALARPRQRWNYDPESDLADLTAAYGFGLVKNHPFLDGNKQIGFVAMNMFLILNDREIEAPEPEVVEVMLGIATGSLDETTLASWVRSVMVP